MYFQQEQNERNAMSFVYCSLGPFDKQFHTLLVPHVSSGLKKHSKTIKALGLHLALIRFLVYGNPDEPLALVYEILLQKWHNAM